MMVVLKWIKSWIPYVVHVVPVVGVLFLVGVVDVLIRWNEPLEWLLRLPFFWNTLSTALLFSSFLFLLGRFACYGLTSLLTYLAVVEFLEFFFRVNFSFETESGGEWLLVLAASSWSEVAEFFQVYWGVGSYAVVLVIVVGLVFFFLFIRKYNEKLAHDGRSLLAGLTCMIPFVLTCVFNLGDFECDGLCGAVVDHKFWPTSRQVEFLEGFNKAAYSPILPQRLYSRFDTDVRPVGVVVLGESSTRNNWSLYGYSRKTTPCMDAVKDELCVFEDVVAAGWLTPISLRFILTDAELGIREQAHYTFPGVLKRAGFRSVLISGQNHWGFFDGLDVVLFHDCGKKIFLSDLCRGSIYYDNALLPLFDEELANSDIRPLIIFLHLQGSHFDPACRYPPDRTVFPECGSRIATKFIDHYDNSIHFTDYLLGELYKRLKKLERPSFFVYISDHGESTSGVVRRDVNDNDVWEIPMFVWWSPQYRKLFPETVKKSMDARKIPLQEDKIFQLLLDLAQIEAWPGATHSSFPPDLKERWIKDGKRIYKPKKNPR